MGVVGVAFGRVVGAGVVRSVCAVGAHDPPAKTTFAVLSDTAPDAAAAFSPSSSS